MILRFPGAKTKLLPCCGSGAVLLDSSGVSTSKAVRIYKTYAGDNIKKVRGDRRPLELQHRQKVSRSLDRENVPSGFLWQVRVAVLNRMHPHRNSLAMTSFSTTSSTARTVSRWTWASRSMARMPTPSTSM
jgi:hypothetical protein